MYCAFSYKIITLHHIWHDLITGVFGYMDITSQVRFVCKALWAFFTSCVRFILNPLNAACVNSPKIGYVEGSCGCKFYYRLASEEFRAILIFLSSGNHPLCADACSGHASWYEYGFPSSVPIESVGSRGQGHTETDEFCFVDFEYVKKYAKLGLSFFVELADFAWSRSVVIEALLWW